MHSLADRVVRLRWLAIPLVAYVFVTLVMPAANGAVGRADFVHHAAWVLGGCMAVVIVAMCIDLIPRRKR